MSGHAVESGPMKRVPARAEAGAATSPATVAHVLLVLLAALLAIAISPRTVSAQDRVEVEGTADFRNPPTLGPGSYSDTMVSGESIWYGVLYTNDTDFRFAVSFADPRATADDDLTLEVALIGPTLGEAGRAEPIILGSASYQGGTTNLWYLEVRLESEGVLGLEYEIQLDVEGVEENQINDCTDDPTCDLDDQLTEVETEILDLETRIGELAEAESAEAVQRDIDDLELRVTDAQSETDEAQRQIALICAPDTTCTELPELDPVTPTWALAAGALVLVLGLGAIGFSLFRRS